MIGIPDKKWLERPLLIVVPKPGQQPSRDDILSFFKARPEISPHNFFFCELLYGKKESTRARPMPESTHLMQTL